MIRKSIFPTIAALCMMLIAGVIAQTNRAAAQQNPNCCIYTVDVNGLSPFCFPVRLVTQWDCSGTPVTLFRTYITNGITIEPIGTPPLLPCPPACKLLAVSMDNVNFTLPNQTRQYIIGNCCYLVTFVYDANGCIYLRIRPC